MFLLRYNKALKQYGECCWSRLGPNANCSYWKYSREKGSEKNTTEGNSPKLRQ